MESSRFSAENLVQVESFGNITLYRADCLEVIPSLKICADAVITDPPYCSGGTFSSDRSAATSKKYQGSDSQRAYPEFAGDHRDQRSFGFWSTLWLGAARAISRPGALCAIFTDWRQLPTSTDAFQGGGWIWRGIAPWDKVNARPQRGRFRNQCEYVVWGSNGPMPMEGACADGVFRHPMNHREKLHIAGKPVALLGDLMELAGETILDPFMGSGTGAIAAIERGKRFIGIEIDQAYFDVACRRVEAAVSAKV